MNHFIQLPYGKKGEGFYVEQLIEHIKKSNRDYIIQGQKNCSLADHTKPSSLDVWLRENFTENKDTKHAVNKVIQDLIETGRFEVAEKLLCPDSGQLCKGIRLLP